jgi:hypothetical protein
VQPLKLQTSSGEGFVQIDRVEAADQPAATGQQFLQRAVRDDPAAADTTRRSTLAWTSPSRWLDRIRRRDLALAVLSIAAYAAYVASSWTDNADPWVLFFTAPFLVGSWAAAGAYIGTRRDLLVSLRDRAERAEAERELRAPTRPGWASGTGSPRKCTTCWLTRCR